MSSWKFEIDKSEIPITEMLTGSYFEVCRDTNVGGKTIKLSPDEISILTLPFITEETADRCLINKDELVKYLFELALKIKPDITLRDVDYYTGRFNYIFLKHTIENHEDKKNIYQLFDEVSKYINGEDGISCYEEKVSPDKLKKIKELIQVKSRTGYNYILWRMRKKTTSVKNLKFLIENFGIDCGFDQITNDGNSALMLACMKIDQCSVVKKKVPMFLIDTLGAKCNPGRVNNEGYTALMYAYKSELPEVAIKIIDTFGIECKPGQVNNEGYTALMYARSEDSQEVAIKLIDTFGAECKPGHVNNENRTALIIACRYALVDLAMKLIDTFGVECNINQVDNEGKTALWYACYYRMKDFIKKMLDNFSKELKIKYVLEKDWIHRIL